jgi:hypothetical protein
MLTYYLFSLALQPSVGYGFFSRGFAITHNDAPQSVGLLRTTDQLVAETSTRQHTKQTSMPPEGFEPTITAVERPQTYALDCSTSGTGPNTLTPQQNIQCTTHLKPSHKTRGVHKQYSKPNLSEQEEEKEEKRGQTKLTGSV